MDLLQFGWNTVLECGEFIVSFYIFTQIILEHLKIGERQALCTVQ